MAVQATEGQQEMLPESGAWPVTEPPPWLELDDAPEPGPLPPDPLGDDACQPDEWSPWSVDEGPEAYVMDPGPPQLPSEQLARMAPGVELAAELEGIDPAAADEYHLVEMIAAYQRVASWSHSQMAHLAAHLSRRAALNPRSPRPGDTTSLNVTGEELAPRLGISRAAANRMVAAGRAFGMKLLETAVALNQGRIDYPKACVLLRQLGDQPDDVAWVVQEEVLPNATHQTVTQLEKAVAKAIIAADPHRATARHRRARDSRRVNHPRVLPDGMASIFAILPATDAAGLDLALEAAARAAKAAGDTRTIDQLRADSLSLLGHGALERGFIGTPQVAGGSPVGAQAPVGAGASNAPPDDAQGRRPDEPVVDLPTDTAGGALAPDDVIDRSDEAAPHLQTGNSFLRTPHMPIGAIGGRRAQIHVTIPLSVLLPPEVLRHPPEQPAGAAGDRCAEGQVPAAAHAGDRCEEGPQSAAAHAGNDCAPDEKPAAAHAGDRCEEGQVPAAAHAGNDCAPDQEPAAAHAGDRCAEVPGEGCAYCEDGLPADWYPGPTPAEVAELDGYGPITPDVARALAYSADSWFRLITDPLSGQLLDVGRTRYRPPAAMADFVRFRDRTCVSPTCPTAARACQLDHVIPWEFGGVTSAANLAPECERDHQVKTSGAFELTHEGGGTFVWTTPSRHRYRRDHTGRITPLHPAPAPSRFADRPNF